MLKAMIMINNSEDLIKQINNKSSDNIFQSESTFKKVSNRIFRT
jgi:hypothetical protein